MPSEAVERVLGRLWALECNPRGGPVQWTARCPSHDPDRNPSFSLKQADDGRALVYCHKGCTLDQVAAALAMDVRELFEPDPAPVRERTVVKVYPYLNADGKLLFEVVRYSDKSFRQRRPDGHGGYLWNLDGVLRVLYRWPQVIEWVKAGRVLSVVEGEKDADALVAKNQAATCNPGGAGKWSERYSRQLKKVADEARQPLKVAVIRDVDPLDPKTGRRPGQEHAEEVRKSLEAVGATVKVLQPAVGKDVSDHLAAGLKLGQLVPATDEARAHAERMEVLSARQVMDLPDPDVEGYLLGPLVYKGHRIVVGGWTGHGKTTFTLHMTAAACYGRDFLNWHGRGELHALIVDVEQGTRTVKRRIRETGLENSERVRYLRVPDGLALDSDADAIADMERIFHRGVDGRPYDIVLADPLYKLTRGDPLDVRAAIDLMRRFDEWRERYQFALILPMHCRKPQEEKRLSVHDLFGSSAYQWGAELLLGLERRSRTETHLYLWKDREGEVAEEGDCPVGSYWKVGYSRTGGYRLYPKHKQEQLVEVAPTPRFDRAQFVYEQIRDNGGRLTYKEIGTLLWQHGHSCSAGSLDNTLSKLGGYGVYKEQAPRKNDNVYRLQDSFMPRS